MISCMLPGSGSTLRDVYLQQAGSPYQLGSGYEAPVCVSPWRVAGDWREYGPAHHAHVVRMRYGSRAVEWEEQGFEGGAQIRRSIGLAAPIAHSHLETTREGQAGRQAGRVGSGTERAVV